MPRHGKTILRKRKYMCKGPKAEKTYMYVPQKLVCGKSKGTK